ncbi:MAG: hypothetical protein ASARMPREDX12_000685 [Alectoria sarmentosa]|nr:MAG: hypothetical protein ASARMPREDX12_000685 [Alectoria sarmentosa]
MNHSLPDLKKEPKPVGKTFAVKPEIKAFILNFMYHGVHAIEANLDQKEEKELAYAAAAQDFIKVKYGIEIKTVDIVKYYIEAQNAPRSAGFQKWNTSVIGTFIAHQIQHKNVYDDATRGPVIAATQTLLDEATKNAGGPKGSVGVRVTWKNLVSSKNPVPDIKDPDLRGYFPEDSPPSPPPSFQPGPAEGDLSFGSSESNVE